MTGTPLQNNLHELWSLLNFVMPQLFSDANVFDEWFDALQQRPGSEGSDTQPKKAEQVNKEMIQKLHMILRPFMLRRTKSEALPDLPQK